MTDLRRFRQGERPYWDEVLKTHRSTVWRVAMAHGEDRDDAEDLFQMAVLRAWERRESYDGRGPVGGWFYQVAKRVCLSEVRRRRNRRRLLERATGMGVLEEVLWSPPTPLEEVLQAEAYVLLRQAAQSLAPREREAFDLRRIQHKSYDEAARLMGITEATVRSQVRKAASHLRESLQGAKGKELRDGLSRD